MYRKGGGGSEIRHKAYIEEGYKNIMNRNIVQSNGGENATTHKNTTRYKMKHNATKINKW